MSGALVARDALRVEVKNRVGAGPRRTYIFRCSGEGCNREVRVRQDALTTHSGRCQSHSHRKRPFESLYNALFNDWRGVSVELSYEEFLTFTQVRDCHYCGSPINWVPFGTVDGKYISRAYFLDRKDTNGSYSAANCIVCCTFCNLVRRDHFSYEEFLLLAPALRQIRAHRRKQCLKT